jgi:hypothetical protein
MAKRHLRLVSPLNPLFLDDLRARLEEADGLISAFSSKGRRPADVSQLIKHFGGTTCV